MGLSEPGFRIQHSLFNKKILFFFFFNYLFIWLCGALVGACGIQFPDQGSNWGPMHWEHGVVATGLPQKSVNK